MKLMTCADVAERQDQAVAARRQFGPAGVLNRLHLLGDPDVTRVRLLDDLIGLDQRLSRFRLDAKQQGECRDGLVVDDLVADRRRVGNDGERLELPRTIRRRRPDRCTHKPLAPTKYLEP